MGSVGEPKITQEKVNAMKRTAKSIDMNSREGYQFEKSVKDALSRTDEPKLKSQLRKILSSLDDLS